MTFEDALTKMLALYAVEINHDLVIVRLPGRTSIAKLEALMALLHSQGAEGEGADPLTWAIAMGASVMLGRRFDTLCFLDGSTKNIPLSREPLGDLRKQPSSTPQPTETSQ